MTAAEIRTQATALNVDISGLDMRKKADKAEAIRRIEGAITHTSEDWREVLIAEVRVNKYTTVEVDDSVPGSMTPATTISEREDWVDFTLDDAPTTASEMIAETIEDLDTIISSIPDISEPAPAPQTPAPVAPTSLAKAYKAKFNHRGRVWNEIMFLYSIA
jgi:hypothetical protein